MRKLVYVDVAEKIMLETLNSQMTPGTRIASVREMSLRFEVNPKTIQKAFDYLDDKGIFTTVVGGGRYLADDANVLNAIKAELINTDIQQFTNKMIQYNCQLSYVIEEITQIYASKEQNE